MAPTLRPLDSALDSSPRRTVLPMVGLRHTFVVESDGEHGGLSLRAGDVLVLGGRVRPGDVTVLLARGRGRARLGTVTSKGLLGTHGEPCSGARWMAAGRVLEVIREPGVVPRSEAQLALDWAAPRTATHAA